jgi:RHS repeat-associated protein
VTSSGAETFAYDAIGRLTSHTSDLGSFTLSYLGQTGQITGRALASSTLTTNWSYLTNTNDRRLSGISNTGLSSGQFSNYTYTTTQENFISGITESSDASAVYPVAAIQTATYNNLNQLTNLSGQALTFDADGHLSSDGQRNYSWDAEGRLIGITYPGVSGKATAFTYDGLSRRVTIASTPPGGGSATTTSYLWCGSDICQARNSSNVAIKGYYGESEFMPGSPGQPYYYGVDQIGSVRRAFENTTTAPAFSYDPYGVPLQSTAPATDFVYGGMFYNADSGLYLTNYRAYDPTAGRWLSRDPIGEPSDPYANLYAYVGGNPVSLVDPTGQQGLTAPFSAAFGVGAFYGSLIGQFIASGGRLSCVSIDEASEDFLKWAAIGAGGGPISRIFSRAFAALAARDALQQAGNPLSEIRSTQAGERFLRYESGNPAFSRVTPNGGLGPGSFAAPANEGVQPQSLLNDRYNLPSPEIPRGTYFEINPSTGTPVIGPRPVAGGSGNEVVFPSGVGPGSVGPARPTPP